MATLNEVGERNLIKNVVSILRPCPSLGPGDDAAVVSAGDENIVISTDMVMFDRHFPKGMTYEQFGWTAVAVNLSDLASMGARPLGVLLALALPENLDEKDLYDIISGADQCAEFCDTFVIGGDTKIGSGIISGTAIGSLDGRKPLMRSGACPGDLVAVTGRVGSAAADYYAIKNGITIDNVSSSLMVPIPKISEGLILSKSGAVTSCMDLSDGIAEASKSICEKSKVGMDIQIEFIPEGDHVERISRELNIDKKDLTLYWGGDYELLFTFKKELIDTLYESELLFSIIGIVTDGDESYIVENEKRTMMGNGCY